MMINYKRPTDKELEAQLKPEEFRVTRKNGTESPFKNEFWNYKEAGIYVDVISGEPLFSSTDKFDSGTGWPSFTRPIEKDGLIEKKDIKFFMTRTEVRSRYADSHLGHVFDDGPAPTGLRYCINSAALKFIPVKQLKEKGLEKYLPLFQVAAEVKKHELATFAGGCFWCMEEPFEKLEGVKNVVVGYTGGTKNNPTYEEVISGNTGHAESVQIEFDPKIVSYDKLLEVFWRQIDPTTSDGQFCDKGNQYRPAVFFHSEEQRQLAEDSKKKLDQLKKFSKPNVTLIVSASTFFPAEEYHQHYYRQNPVRYKFYRSSCGRDKFLEKIWGKNMAH